MNFEVELKSTPFRVWLWDQWYDYRETLTEEGRDCVIDYNDYFRKYKWWLKRQYMYVKSQK